MRKLKFRAWDKTNRIMLDRVLAGPGDPCSIVWDAARKEWVNFDDACGTIMQFIGLQDKDGKDIYEGDIVEGPYYHGKLDSGHATRDSIDIASIARGCFPFIQYEGPGWKDATEDECKVIGNIYEHPELLATSEEKQNDKRR